MTGPSNDRPQTQAGHRVSDEAWSKAIRVARELDRVLDGDLQMREAVSRAVVELRLSTRQVYNHLARYRGERRVSSVLPRTNDVRRARISTGVEAIIAETLQEMWLRPEKLILPQSSMRSARAVQAKGSSPRPMSPLPSGLPKCSPPRRSLGGGFPVASTCTA